MKTKTLFQVLSTLMLLSPSFGQSAQFDIARDGFDKTFYQGRWILKSDADTLSNVGLDPAKLGDAARYRLFTTTIKLDDRPAYVVPDLVYPVKSGDGPDTLGLRLIPIKNQRWNEEDPSVEAPTAQLDAFLKKIFYGDENADKQIYAFVPHSSSSDSYFDDFTAMAQSKVETSTGHVSAYTGQGHNSRRQMLYGGSSDSVFSVSLKGVPQEAVNTNTAIWTKLYYQNPDGYLFADDYHFDWVVNTNLQETFAFGTGWIDRNWKRKDLNALINVRKQQLEAQGVNVVKDVPFDETTPYYRMLRDQSPLALYCFEGVANFINLGLSIPLTKVYFERIWGVERGDTLFALVDQLYADIQTREVQGITDAGGEATSPIPPDFQPDSLDGPKLKPVLAQMKALWELEDGLENPAQYTAQNPLFPDRDAAGQPVGYAANARRDEELKKDGHAMPWKPETTSEILRDLIYMYAPFQKVGAARSTALILSFKAQITLRTGIATDVIKNFAAQIVSPMFKHEANWVLARLKASGASDAVVELKFAGYKKQTLVGLNQIIDGLKHADGIQPGDEDLGLDAEELAVLREFRRRRNQAASEEAKLMIATVITPAIDEAQTSPIANYSVDGYTSFKNFYSEIQPVMATIAEVPVKEADILNQVLTGQRFVKFNNRPGLPIVIAHGIHPTNKNVKLQTVATVISADYVEEQDPMLIDEHVPVLQNFFASFGSGSQRAASRH